MGEEVGEVVAINVSAFDSTFCGVGQLINESMCLGRGGEGERRGEKSARTRRDIGRRSQTGHAHTSRSQACGGTILEALSGAQGQSPLVTRVGMGREERRGERGRRGGVAAGGGVCSCLDGGGTC